MLLTIITPVYNRASLLESCYQSLRRQTDFDFEWIVVDDGSSDGSADTAAAFSDDLFPIRVIRKENGGKHTAINAAIPHIQGSYTLILDSDDMLTPDAVAEVRCAWSKYDRQEDIGIVTFLKGTDQEHPVCTVAQFDTPVDILRCPRKKLLHTDCCEIVRSEFLRRYPFPEFPGERFIAECALWNRIARTHQCIYQKKIIYLCEYMEGGLTHGGRALRIKNPKGGMFTSELRIHSNNSLSQRIKYAMLYCCYGFFSGLSPAAILRQDSGCLWLKILALIPGYGLYLRWKKQHGA